MFSMRVGLIFVHKDRGMAGFNITVSGHHIETLRRMTIPIVTLENELKFDAHKNKLHDAASRHINALQRPPNVLIDNRELFIYQLSQTTMLALSSRLWAKVSPNYIAVCDLYTRISIFHQLFWCFV